MEQAQQAQTVKWGEKGWDGTGQVNGGHVRETGGGGEKKERREEKCEWGIL